MNKPKKSGCFALLIRIHLYFFGGILGILFVLFFAMYVSHPGFRRGSHDMFYDFCDMFTWRASIGECQEIGNRIVGALESYKKDNQQYPDKLESLVPEYLSEIPEQPLGNKQWEYRHYKNRSQFALEAHPYRRESIPCLVYYSSKKEWWLDKGL